MATSDPVRSERVVVFDVEPAPGAAPASGLERLLAYLAEAGPHAGLSRLDGSDAETTGDRAISPATMSGSYLFRAHSKIESQRLEELLRGDPRVRSVYRPPAYRARRAEQAIAPATAPRSPAPWDPVIAAKIAKASTLKQWGLERCGFPEVRGELDRGGDPHPLVVLDNGSHLAHPQLAGVIRKYVAPKKPRHASIADHAGSVAAIVGARRNERERESTEMDGCCSAEIELFNIWTTNDGLDHDVLYNGLARAIAHKRPVVNISLWLHDYRIDDKVASLLDECEKHNVVVVAAIGNAGTSSETFFPATHPTVIAVAATDAGDQRSANSSVGRHAFIAAPGENIYTVVGDTEYDRMTGTSFAAPFVTAAVWLARRRRPDLTPVQVRWLLSQSVAQPGAPRNPEVGFGRLDMPQLVRHLDKVPSPDECARFLEDSLTSAEIAVAR